MQFPVEVKIEMSTTGKTFGIAFHKPGAEKPIAVIKGCKLASGSNGSFVSGPSTKMDDGKWFNYLFLDKAFGEYLTKEVEKVMPQQQSSGGGSSEDIPF